jgi:hypothetical protein
MRPFKVNFITKYLIRIKTLLHEFITDHIQFTFNNAYYGSYPRSRILLASPGYIFKAFL